MSLQIQKQIQYFDRTYDLGALLLPKKVLVIYGPRQAGKTSLLNVFTEKNTLKIFQSTGDDMKLKIMFSEPDFDGLINFAKNYELLIIDEAQRIYPEQLSTIVEKVKTINGRCIFSYDKVQTLAKWEEQRDIDSKINNIEDIVKYKLSDIWNGGKLLYEYRAI